MMRGVHVAAEIVAAARTLTRHRLAAIILWNPPMGVLGGGVVLDALVSRELLTAILTAWSAPPSPSRGDRSSRTGRPSRTCPCPGSPSRWDERTGELPLRDRRGRVASVDVAGLAEILRQAT